LLLGLYSSTLEDKNRLVLPDGFKEEYKDGIYITRGFDRNIMALTLSAFESIYERVMSLNLTDPVVRLLLRMVLGNAYRAEITPDWKIDISDTLKEAADLEREVILVGQGDFVELWSPDNWSKQEEKLINVEANQFSALNIASR
jgi:MraZ protein